MLNQGKLLFILGLFLLASCKTKEQKKKEKHERMVLKLEQANENYVPYKQFSEKIVGGSLDEMWKINKKFIDDQKALGKEFWFSHDPFSPIEGQFYAREINYLIDEGVTDFVKIGDSWKAVW